METERQVDIEGGGGTIELSSHNFISSRSPHIEGKRDYSKQRTKVEPLDLTLRQTAPYSKPFHKTEIGFELEPDSPLPLLNGQKKSGLLNVESESLQIYQNNRQNAP